MTNPATPHRPRACPLCGGAGQRRAFPFATRFNGQKFDYLACSTCGSVYVDPVPDPVTFNEMYAKSAYHDTHYQYVDDRAYLESARILRELLPQDARVLDYGCGTGAFLRALMAAGFSPAGVEFDADAAFAAERNTRCAVLTVDQFWAGDTADFDAIHLGDVLEHLPEPAAVLRLLLRRLRPGGILYVEGPLEINASPVYWCAALFGWTKHLARPRFIASHAPTHLFRAGGRQQLSFFLREPGLSLSRWELYETGWPYAQGGTLKRLIAGAAVALSKLSPVPAVFGNRFRGLFLYKPALDQHSSMQYGTSTR